MRAVLPDIDPQTKGLRLGELPDPFPGAGEVLIGVEASALNRADLLQMQGLYPPPAGESPVPGLEAAGRVLMAGDGVEEVTPGERVMALLAGGGHAEKVVVPVGQIMPIPERLSFVEAAALPEAALTSWTNLVVEGGLHRGQTVLITAAASGVGTLAVQLARELEARVLVAGRDLDRLERLRELGADGLCLLGEELEQQVREQNGGRGVDLVMDMVGGAGLDQHLRALTERGRLVLVGLMAGPRSDLDLGLIMRRRLRLVGSVLRARSRAEKAGLVAGFAEFAGERLASGRLRPIVDRVVPLARIADAYRQLEQGGLFGKLVVSVGPEASSAAAAEAFGSDPSTSPAASAP